MANEPISPTSSVVQTTGPDGKPITTRVNDTSNLGRTAEAEFDADDVKHGTGALAKSYVPSKGGSGEIDVVGKYPWTMSKVQDRDDIPYIRLKEYKVNEATLSKQLGFFTAVAANKASALTPGKSSTTGMLDIYDEIFPRDKRTPWSYKFPYFSDSSYTLNTPPWQKLDDIGPAIMEGGKSMAESLGKMGFKGAEKFANKVLGGVEAVASLGNTAADVALKLQYPAVGIADRPKIFTSHNERSITIEFPLFNTIKEYDWALNREFINLFMSQNLYNKRDYITGIPPVFYDVEIPGQYFSVASTVTNFSVKNLGNTRMIDGFIIPDAWQITIELAEMAMPSKNQFAWATKTNNTVSTGSK